MIAYFPRVVVAMLLVPQYVLLVQSVSESLAKENTGELLPPIAWDRLDRAVDRGLSWLSSQQRHDGSFPTHETGQPAVTSLCVLGYLARGHQPNVGLYAPEVDRALNFVSGCLQPNDLLSKHVPPSLDVSFQLNRPGHTAAYNHAISGLMLCEVFGMVDQKTTARIRPIIEKAIERTLTLQLSRKRDPVDLGGWRYTSRTTDGHDSDLSVTSWQLLFLRSAKNAGFEVPAEVIDAAMSYVRRLYNPPSQTFKYAINYREADWTTRAMTGAGILSLSMGGQHETEMARKSGKWVLDQSFREYNNVVYINDSYHYGVFYCALGIFQLGPDYYTSYYPTVMSTLLANQQRQGNWQADAEHKHIGDESDITPCGAGPARGLQYSHPRCS
jgi:hypothetical protein